MPSTPRKNITTQRRKGFDASRNSVARNEQQKMYRTQGWRRVRKQHLQANPLCVSCEAQGITVAAQVVDHVRPWRGDLDLFWDESNWQSLCHTCHNRKSAAESRKG